MANAKSTVEEIRQRFDNDVERFSNLDTGQTATMDAPLALSLATQAAAAVSGAGARDMLDIGCGAGNYSLKMLQTTPNLNVTLVDLSRPMLDRAVQRVTPMTPGAVTPIQGDIRDIDLGEKRFDIVLAAMVLHHLRGDDEWISVFAKLHRAIRPGGSCWIVDHVEHGNPAIQRLMHARWGDYLAGFGGEALRDRVFAYTEKEDTPRPLLFQTELMRRVGFTVDVLHFNTLFAVFGGVR